MPNDAERGGAIGLARRLGPGALGAGLAALLVGAGAPAAAAALGLGALAAWLLEAGLERFAGAAAPDGDRQEFGAEPSETSVHAADHPPHPAAEPPEDESAAGLALSAGRALRDLPAAVILLDERGGVLFANAAARRETGHELSGRHFASALRAPGLVEAVRRAIDEQQAGETSFLIRRAQERHLTALVTPLPPPELEFAAQSLTPARKLALARDRARALILIQDDTRIRRAEQLHRDFVANASHELKTPLAALAGFIETLGDAARDDPRARDRFLGLMARQAERMRRLLEDLLSLNRIELNEHVPPRERVDLRPILIEAAALAEPLEPRAAGAASDAPRLDIRLPETLPLVIGDADQLTQLFVNLFTNALKYGGDRKPALVEAEILETPRPRLGVSVRDFGPGVPKELIPRLTERFYRVQEPAHRGKTGTGLGLAIVKHIVGRHGGELTIESEPGRGSRFTIWLPRAGSER